MTRIMGDSTSLTAIPLTVNIAAAYYNGHVGVATAAQMQARFPHDKYGWCLFDVTGANADKADALDVENGDATPATANLWVQSWHKLGRPGLAPLYVNRGNEQAVISACESGGSKLGAQFGLIVSTLDGTIVPPGTGILACQVKGAKLTGGDWDMSLVYDASLWLPVAPPPKPMVVSDAQAKAAAASVVSGGAVLALYVDERS